MSLRERLANQAGVVMLRPEAGIGHSISGLKVAIHQKLLDRVDLAVMESLTEERLREEIAQLVQRLLAEDAVWSTTPSARADPRHPA